MRQAVAGFTLDRDFAADHAFTGGNVFASATSTNFSSTNAVLANATSTSLFAATAVLTNATSTTSSPRR